MLPCPECHGKRLKEHVLAVKINGKSIADVTDLSIEDLITFFDTLPLTEKEEEIAKLILREINSRLAFLQQVGLGYLTLSRSAGSLSGGEAQRIRLATQIGSNLMGVLYILDEPSIGLHQRDNQKLIATLKHLRDIGNTLIVVEHDEHPRRLQRPRTRLRVSISPVCRVFRCRNSGGPQRSLSESTDAARTI